MNAPSPLAFGCMQFGGRADAQAARAMFDAARAAGITHFDTAHVYTDGQSERLIGEFAQGDAEVTIATKVGYSGGAGRANLSAQFDESLRRLGTDAVDLLYLHRFDPATSLEETISLFVEWQQSGRITRIGLSNFAAWQVMKAQAVAARFGSRIDVIQPMYNLVKRQVEVELLPMCADQAIAVHAYSPLGGGLLTGKYAQGGAGRLSEDSRYAARYAPEAMHQAAIGLAALASEMGTHPATLAVAWVMSCPITPVIPLISARDAAQLAPSLAALSLPMTVDLRARLSALYPAPPPATDRLEEE
ncbi:MAG: aldo/keto reductase [Rhodobacter sp.]|nr:aldo/keto reductase [Rhodobacter sp.]